MKSAAPGSLSHIFAFAVYFSFAFIFISIKQKIQKYLSAIYLFSDIFILSTTFTSHSLPNEAPYPKRIHNPFNTSGYEYLLFVCRCCLRGVRRFSYWFDNLGLILERNT